MSGSLIDQMIAAFDRPPPPGARMTIRTHWRFYATGWNAEFRAWYRGVRQDPHSRWHDDDPELEWL